MRVVDLKHLYKAFSCFVYAAHVMISCVCAYVCMCTRICMHVYALTYHVVYSNFFFDQWRKFWDFGLFRGVKAFDKSSFHCHSHNYHRPLHSRNAVQRLNIIICEHRNSASFLQIFVTGSVTGLYIFVFIFVSLAKFCDSFYNFVLRFTIEVNG